MAFKLVYSRPKLITAQDFKKWRYDVWSGIVQHIGNQIIGLYCFHASKQIYIHNLSKVFSVILSEQCQWRR